MIYSPHSTHQVNAVGKERLVLDLSCRRQLRPPRPEEGAGDGDGGGGGDGGGNGDGALSSAEKTSDGQGPAAAGQGEAGAAAEVEAAEGLDDDPYYVVTSSRTSERAANVCCKRVSQTRIVESMT